MLVVQLFNKPGDFSIHQNQSDRSNTGRIRRKPDQLAGQTKGLKAPMASFWQEIKRRRVARALVVYSVIAWALIQIADIVAPALLLPSWVSRLVTFLMMLGYPIVIAMAWAYDLTPDGLSMTKSTDTTEGADDDQEVADSAIPSTTNISESEPSIAVLPFSNISPDPEQEYFSDGISEELINTLSRVRGIRVAARTSSFYFKDKNEKIQVIGRELGVQTVLEGSVRTAENRVRVATQLINVEDGYQLWSDTYDYERDNLLRLQEIIARAIIQAISGEFFNNENTRLLPMTTANESAFEDYLRGRFLWQRRELQSTRDGIALLKAAIEKDPAFASAHASLAGALHKLPLYDAEADPETTREEAATAARNALALDPESNEAHAILGSILAETHEYLPANNAFLKAMKYGPENVTAQHWYAIFLLNTGRLSSALSHIERAARIDPLNGGIAGTRASIYFALGRLDEALSGYRDAIQLGWSDAARAFLGTLYLHKGDFAQARDNLLQGRFSAEAIPQRLVDALCKEQESSGSAVLAATNSGEISKALGFRLCAMTGSIELFNLRVDATDIPGDSLAAIWFPSAHPLRQDLRFHDFLEPFSLQPLWAASSWPDRCKETADGFECD